MQPPVVTCSRRWTLVIEKNGFAVALHDDIPLDNIFARGFARVPALSPKRRAISVARRSGGTNFKIGSAALPGSSGKYTRVQSGFKRPRENTVATM